MQLLDHGFSVAQKIAKTAFLTLKLFNDPLPRFLIQSKVIILCAADRSRRAEHNPIQQPVRGPVTQNVTDLSKVERIEHTMRKGWELPRPFSPRFRQVLLDSFEKASTLSHCVMRLRILAVDGNHMCRFGKPAKRSRTRSHDPIRWHDRRNPFQKPGVDVRLASNESRVNEASLAHSMEKLDDLVVPHLLNPRLRPPVTVAADRAAVGYVERETPCLSSDGFQRRRQYNREQPKAAFRALRVCRHRVAPFLGSVRDTLTLLWKMRGHRPRLQKNDVIPRVSMALLALLLDERLHVRLPRSQIASASRTEEETVDI